MKLLTSFEISQVSGGRRATDEEMWNSMEHYSFLSALIGGCASGIYAFSTNQVMTVTIGTATSYTASFASTFMAGLGLSWGAGLVVGLGVAAYNAEFA